MPPAQPPSHGIYCVRVCQFSDLLWINTDRHVFPGEKYRMGKVRERRGKEGRKKGRGKGERGRGGEREAKQIRRQRCWKIPPHPWAFEKPRSSPRVSQLEFQSGSLLSGQRRTASLQTVTPAVEGVETDGRKEPEVHRAWLPRPSPPLASDHACLATSLRESCSRWAQRLDVWAPAGAGWRIPVSDEVSTELRTQSET